MSKVLTAACALNVVVADSFPVAGATVLSEGIGPSTGILVMDGDRKYYITSNASDLKTTIDKTASAIGQIVTLLGGLGVPAPSLLPLTAIAAELTILKETLK